MSQVKRTAKTRRAGWLLRRVAVAALALLAIQQLGLPKARPFGDAQPVRAAEREPARGRVTQTIVRPIDVGDPGVAAPAAQLAVVTQPPAAAPALIWRGRAGQDGYLRSAPNLAAPIVGELKAGQPLEVTRWVSGQEVETENTTWADLGGSLYAYSALLRSRPVAAPPLPANASQSGRWIDVNLTLQIATAYDGTTPLKSVLVSTGRPGWDTPTGVFQVQRRVAKEIMDGSTLLGQGPDGRGATYKVENVRWVQYFTADGSALHENYWRNPALFGIPGSHGCVGLLPADAAWFWDFATSGTPIVVH